MTWILTVVSMHVHTTRIRIFVRYTDCMQRERGYVGLLLLLVSSVILVGLYLHFTPLTLITPVKSDGTAGTTTTEAQTDIQAAQQVKDVLESQNKATNQMLQ